MTRKSPVDRLSFGSSGRPSLTSNKPQPLPGMTKSLLNKKPISPGLFKDSNAQLGRSITPSYSTRANFSSSFTRDQSNKRASSNQSNRDKNKPNATSTQGNKPSSSKISHQTVQNAANKPAAFFSYKSKLRGRSFSPSLLAENNNQAVSTQGILSKKL